MPRVVTGCTIEYRRDTIRKIGRARDFRRLRAGVSPHAIIDVGSRAIHLLVGEVENDVVLPVAKEKISVCLGSGVDKIGDRGGPDPRGCQGHKAFLRTSAGRKELQLSEHKR